MTRRRTVVLATIVIALCASGMAVPFPASAQQKDKVWHIGYLECGTRQFTRASGRYAAFIDGIRALGHVERKDFAVEGRIE